MAQANVTIGVKSSAFKSGLDDMRSHAKEWAGSMTGVIAGAFSISAVTSFVSGFVTQMARVKDLADRLGESSDTIQRVGNAAKLSGSDLEFVIKNLTKMSGAAAKGADEFAKVGISADAFVNAGTEEKILMLAKAYDEANGSQQKMSDLMTVLGPKGQDMLILLSQGAASLNEQLGKFPTVSEEVVNAMAQVDDAVEEFGQTSYVVFDSVLQKLATIGAAMGAVTRMFTKGGTFGGNMQDIFEEVARVEAGKKSAKSRNKDFANIDEDGIKAKADESKKAAEAAKSLDEEMLNLARSRMDAEQKITDLKREQAVHAAAAQDKSKSDAERANSAIKVLQIQQEIESGQADIAKTKKKEQDDLAKDADRKAKDAAKAEADLAEEERAQKLEKMKPEDRIKELKKQQKELNDAAAKETDPKTKAEKKLEALKLNDAIDAAMKEKDGGAKSKPSVISSSLASVGGGGGAYVGTDPALTEARRTNNILASIDRKLGQGGSSFTAPRNPF
jgi:hypothetical protein